MVAKIGVKKRDVNLHKGDDGDDHDRSAEDKGCATVRNLLLVIIAVSSSQ